MKNTKEQSLQAKTRTQIYVPVVVTTFTPVSWQETCDIGAASGETFSTMHLLVFLCEFIGIERDPELVEIGNQIPDFNSQMETQKTYNLMTSSLM